MSGNGVQLARIAGTGCCVPSRVLTNADLERMVDTSHEWIVTRTGIVERHLAKPEEATSDLATEAARNALESAGVSPAELDLILVATATPDMLFPSTACFVQQKLGAPKMAAFDISAACCGFLYGLTIAKQFIASGEYRTVVVVGAETLSKIVDWKDRGTCVLFGDGAGAVVVRASDRPGRGILASQLWADGNLTALLNQPAGGSANPTTHETIDKGMHHLRMAGSEVFKHAVRVMAEGVANVLKKSGLEARDVDLFIPHQANLRIIQAVADRLDVPMEKVLVNIDRYGNTSAASIGIGLDEVSRGGRLKEGQVVAMAAFGAGLTMAATVMRW